MSRPFRFSALGLPLCCALILAGCVLSGSSRSRVAQWQSRYRDFALQRVTAQQLLAEVNLRVDLIPAGTVGRKVKRPMTPRFITIHSTQNPTGTAYHHALALKRGSLRAPKRKGGNRIGYLTWHFTVQQDVAIQHLPCREQGEHADFDGPGNNTSIGIEMCEHQGNDLALTIDKTARLAAYLMHTYGLGLERVVPHYHWPRISPHISQPHKDCPHFLLDNGRPGATWRWFLGRVELHHRRLLPPAALLSAR
jgi:N-acetylmuramoyl-L-alanine amidase